MLGDKTEVIQLATRLDLNPGNPALERGCLTTMSQLAPLHRSSCESE